MRVMTSQTWMPANFVCLSVRLHTYTWTNDRTRSQEEVLADLASRGVLSHSSCCSQRPEGNLLTSIALWVRLHLYRPRCPMACFVWSLVKSSMWNRNSLQKCCQNLLSVCFCDWCGLVENNELHNKICFCLL